ncbi:NACHT, LRR and PYD domains-containing protein 3-like isoform X3 [Colossoma macropomum]|nr:NACHT, LRR and PYD domains-containing protein 3-like isoform X3 [Colossoma macropomum]
MEETSGLQDEDTSTTQSVKSAPSILSYASEKTTASMKRRITFQGEKSPNLSPVQQDRSVPSAPSCVSLKSDHSMEPPITINDKPPPSGHHPVQQDRSVPSAPSCVSLKSDHSMDPPITINDKPPPSGHQMTSLRSNETSSTVEQSICVSPKGPAMLSFTGHESYEKYKANLKDRFQRLSDGLQHHGHSVLLNEIYTELYITEGGIGEVNNEHEVRQIEMAARTQSSTDDTPIKCNDIFRPLLGHDKLIKTVLTKGVAGIGKTVSVQKFIVDWVEGEANQDIRFIFPLPFRELNLINTQPFSLEGLVHHFFPQIKDMKFTHIADHNTVFIFDGLDERRLSLNFLNGAVITDATDMTTVDVLLTNLIKGNLLPSAKIWITSRPAAAGQIPVEFISQVTEIRGFNDPQKEEYFKKRITDQSLADRTIMHLKSSRSLYIMCHIPVFCWISATVLEKMLRDAEGTTIPRTLTQMYTHFLIIQTCIRKEKYSQTGHTDKEMIFKLGQLAFKQLIKGNLIFYEEDLKECDIDVKDAVVYSGVCTQIFREESELYLGQGKVFCFVHLSIQEHLAALYVYVSFSEGNKAVLNQWNPTKIAATFSCSSISDLQQSAVDKALRSTNGQFDLFLRFLLGLSQESNQSLLQMLLPQVSACGSHNVEKTIDYIKIRLRMNLSPEKYINLFHCLNELNDSSLQDEILNLLSAGRLSKTKLSPAQWSALVFVLLTSEREVEVFDLRKYSLNNADECLYRMLPVVKASRTADSSSGRRNLSTARLSGRGVRHCNLSDKGFQALTSALSSKSSNLRELKLSGNVMHGSGTQILSEGLKSPHCKLETLDLSDCEIKEKDCCLLASALNSNPLHLRELDLSFNFLGDFGMKQLSEVLRKPSCRLEKLKLFCCELTAKSCVALSIALKCNTSLTELDLSKNALQDSGVKQLSAGLRNSHSKLRSLSLADCGLTEVGCSLLCAALRSKFFHLSELYLNFNSLRDPGVKFICEFLKQPHCKLEKLSLSQCDISEGGCAALASALRLNPSHLRELELSGNKPGSSGKQLLKALQEHKDFRLEKLKI